MIRLITILGLLTISLLGCTKKSESVFSATAPSSWVRLPEDGGSKAFEAPSSDFTRSVHAAFAANTRAMDDITPSAEPSPGKWHLGGMMANFSLSMEGLFGLVGIGGTTALEVIWKRSLAKPAKHSPQSAVVIGPKLSDAEIAKRLEPAIQAVMATGRVNDRETLRENLMTRAKNFRSLTAGLAAVQATQKFVPHELRLELNIDASGMVSPLITVGGGVGLRLDWSLEKDAVRGPDGEPKTIFENNFSDFALGVSEDIAEAIRSNTALQDANFGLEEIKFSLGISEDGEIGIASESVSLVGTVVYEKAEEKNAPVDFQPFVARKPHKPIRLIGKTKDTNAVRFATMNGIVRESNAFLIPHDKFQDGLAKAIQMGDYFAERAAEAESANWKVVEVSPSYNVSVSGAFGLTTVQGTAGVELTFKRGKASE